MLLFYVPCPDKKSAEHLAQTLLQEKLIGCANIIPGMESWYFWEGKIESSAECILILKTIHRDDTIPLIEKRVAELHPYEVPCILSLPVESINSLYLSWLAQSLGE